MTRWSNLECRARRDLQRESARPSLRNLLIRLLTAEEKL